MFYSVKMWLRRLAQKWGWIPEDPIIRIFVREISPYPAVVKEVEYVQPPLEAVKLKLTKPRMSNPPKFISFDDLLNGRIK
jgi:hypothetical protein